MDRLFGKPTAPPKKETPAPVAAKKEEEKKVDINEFSGKLEGQIRELNGLLLKVVDEIKVKLEQAKKCKGTRQELLKQECLMLVKQKRMYEEQLKALMGSKMSLDQTRFAAMTVENTLQTQEVLKQTLDCQRNRLKEIDVDRIAELREELEEMRMEQQEMMEDMQDVDLDYEDYGEDLSRHVDQLQEESWEKGQRAKKQKQPS